MEVTQTHIDHAAILHLTGRMDASTSASVEQVIQSVLSEGKKNIVLECGALSYISSAGLRVVLSAAKKTKAAGGKLALSSLTSDVKQVFEISGFSSILPIYETEAEAIKAVG